MMTGAAGGSYQLLEVGAGGMRLKAEGWAGRVMVDGGERIDAVTLGMQRARLAVEWTQGYRSLGGDEGSRAAFVARDRPSGGGQYPSGEISPIQLWKRPPNGIPSCLDGRTVAN